MKTSNIQKLEMDLALLFKYISSDNKENEKKISMTVPVYSRRKRKEKENGICCFQEKL